MTSALTCQRPIMPGTVVAATRPWQDGRRRVFQAMKRIATLALYAIGTLAILYLALYAYAMLRQKSFTPGEPIHIFRNPDAPDYS
jgi:hypothetical protein